MAIMRLKGRVSKDSQNDGESTARSCKFSLLFIVHISAHAFLGICLQYMKGLKQIAMICA